MLWFLQVDSNYSVKPFTFNVLFEPEARQRDVFEHSGVKKLVSMAVDGYVPLHNMDNIILFIILF